MLHNWVDPFFDTWELQGLIEWLQSVSGQGTYSVRGGLNEVYISIFSGLEMPIPAFSFYIYIYVGKSR